MQAAKRPSINCLVPANQTGFPVKIVPAAPNKKRAKALNTALVITAWGPLQKKKGKTGIMAPKEKRKKEDRAATVGEPPFSSGSIPSSSRVRASIALALFSVMCLAKVTASAGFIPLDS